MLPQVGVGLAPVWLTRFSPFRSCPRQHELARYGRNGKSLIGPFINGVASHTKAMPQAWSPFAKSSHGVAVHHQLLGGLTEPAEAQKASFGLGVALVCRVVCPPGVYAYPGFASIICFGVVRPCGASALIVPIKVRYAPLWLIRTNGVNACTYGTYPRLWRRWCSQNRGSHSCTSPSSSGRR